MLVWNTALQGAPNGARAGRESCLFPGQQQRTEPANCALLVCTVKPASILFLASGMDGVTAQHLDLHAKQPDPLHLFFPFSDVSLVGTKQSREAHR